MTVQIHTFRRNSGLLRMTCVLVGAPAEAMRIGIQVGEELMQLGLDTRSAAEERHEPVLVRRGCTHGRKQLRRRGPAVRRGHHRGRGLAVLHRDRGCRYSLRHHVRRYCAGCLLARNLFEWLRLRGQSASVRVFKRASGSRKSGTTKDLLLMALPIRAGWRKFACMHVSGTGQKHAHFPKHNGAAPSRSFRAKIRPALTAA